MNRAAFATIVFCLALLLVSACSCPTPTSPADEVALILEPSAAVVIVGAQQQFCASGPPGPYTWTVSSGGGTIQPTTSFCAVLTAGHTIGIFTVIVQSQVRSASARVQIVAN